jgi:hypothetical protein
MTDESPRRRSGGRAGRQAARLHAHAEKTPFLTRRLKPFEVLRVLDRDGNLLEENRAEPVDVIRADTAFVMTNMLRGVLSPRGTGALTGFADILIDMDRPLDPELSDRVRRLTVASRLRGSFRRCARLVLHQRRKDLCCSRLLFGLVQLLSDFVSLHLPLNSETTHLLDERRIGLMKTGAVLINTARGALVDETALVKALKEKHLCGAALESGTHPPCSDRDDPGPRC